MAVDTNSLAYLIDPFWQGEGINGKPLVAGYMCVYIAGTDQKYITWQNWDGTRHPFKIPLGSDGRATILVEVQYTYDCYLYDSFGNLVCSRLNVKPAIGGDVTVYGLTEVWHDGTMSGEGTPQSPLTVVSAGKVYDGIEPIVVNNIENKISANHVPLGVQDPLYFVQDDEEGCILGIDSSACGKTYSGISPILVDNTANTISITGNIGKDWTEEILSAANDASAAATAWTDSQGYLTGVDLSDYATEDWVTGQGYLTAHQSLDGLMSAELLEISDNKITGYNGTAFAGQGGVSGDFTLVEGNGIQLTDDPIAQTTTISVSGDYATNTQLQSVSADITAMIPTALTGDYLDKASADTLYYPLNNNPNNYLTTAYTPEFAYHDTAISSIDNSALYDTSAQARINTLAGRISTLSSEKADATALTAYQEITGMTAYQPAGAYLTTGDSANFLTAVPDTYLQNTDLGIVDNKVTAISGIVLSTGTELNFGYIEI